MFFAPTVSERVNINVTVYTGRCANRGCGSCILHAAEAAPRFGRATTADVHRAAGLEPGTGGVHKHLSGADPPAQM